MSRKFGKTLQPRCADKGTEDGENASRLDIIVRKICLGNSERYYSLEVAIKTQKIRKMLQAYVDIILIVTTMRLRNSERKETRRWRNDFCK